MCLILSLALLGPRAVILLWWFVSPGRWELTFSSFLVPLVGFALLPWTTLMYVVVAPTGVNGLDFLWLGLSAAIDLGSYAGGSGARRSRGSSPSTAGR